MGKKDAWIETRSTGTKNVREKQLLSNKIKRKKSLKIFFNLLPS